MKKLYFILLLGSIVTYSQEVKTKTTSTLGDNIAYFIKNKLVAKEILVAIKPDEIETVNVVKRDTVVDNKKYTNQIFIILKPTTKYE